MTQKQGLPYLIQQARLKGLKIYRDQKTIIIPIFSFINQLVQSLKGYLHSHKYQYWSSHFLDQHYNQRSLSNMIRSWQKLKLSSLQCNLLQSFLKINSKSRIKLYLKVRKLILHTTTNFTMIDQILLTLQDTITIVHKLFQNQSVRKLITSGIKNIFVAFKVSQAKIYSPVFIQYLLSVHDSIIRLEQQQITIQDQFIDYKSKDHSNKIDLYSSISNFQSSIHQDNGMYKKTNFSHASHKKYQIIDRKFLPMKQTSEYVSQQNKNSFQFPSRFKNLGQKQKSSFFDFISKPSKQDKISQEYNNIESINSFYKSQQKKQNYELQQFRQKYQDKIQEHIPTNDRQKTGKNTLKGNEKPNKIIQQLKFKNSQIKPRIDLPQQNNKNFSLNFFSKKLDFSDSYQNQSLLKKVSENLKKQLIQKQNENQPDISFNSTDQYQIQNYLINSSKKDKIKNIAKIKAENDRKSRSKSKKASKQSKVEQFQKLIQKNKEFKEKMLKKSFNSNELNEQQFQSKIKLGQNLEQKTEIDPQINIMIKKQDEDEVWIETELNDQNMQKTKIRIQKSNQSKSRLSDRLSNLKSVVIKDSKFLNSLSNIYNTRAQYQSSCWDQNEQIDNSHPTNQQITNKININKLQKQRQSEQKHIIHKSTNIKAKLKQLNRLQNQQNQLPNDNSRQDYIQSNKQQINISKMRQMAQIFDNYHVNNKRKKELYEQRNMTLEDGQFEMANRGDTDHRSELHDDRNRVNMVKDGDYSFDEGWAD